MALLVDDLLERASRLLNDEARTRWSSTELIEWINDGQYAVCALHPPAYSGEVTVTLVAGTRQALPAGSTRLLGEVYNDSDGSAVTPCDRSALDDAFPGWRSSTYASATAEHYIYAPGSDPLEFLLYPAQPTGTSATLSAVTAQNPPAATAASELPLEEKYRPALVNYLCFRALSKDAEEGSGAMAQAYYQAFESAVKEAAGNAGQ